MFGEGLKRQSFKESHEVQLWLLRLACVGTHRPAPSPLGVAQHGTGTSTLGWFDGALRAL